MEPKPTRSQDPLALAFFGAALVLLAALLLYVFFFRSPEPAPAKGTADVVEGLRRKITELAKESTAKRPAAPAPEPAAPQAAGSRSAAPPAAPVAGATLEAGRSWRYAVVVEPPIWRDITLTYRTRREGAGIGVLTDFVHAGGKSNFHLGVFSPGHATHANTRFPGFFMYAAYLKQPLKPGDPVGFGWQWQGKSPRSTKRFAGTVTTTAKVLVPAGTYLATVVEGTWTYTEDGQVRARAHEKFWYAPEVSQIVRIERLGITPDESSQRIVAELADYR